MGQRSWLAGVVAILANSALCVVVAQSFADAPRRARIVDGRSMAGVTLGSKAPLAPTGDRVRSGVLASWGRVLGGICLEGSSCSWRVAAAGTVQVTLRAPSSSVYRINTDAPRWRTTRGIGRGSTTRSLRRAYGSRIRRRTTCGLNGFGGVNRGYVLNSRQDGERRFTFFELSRSREHVSRIWIGRGRAGSGTAC